MSTQILYYLLNLIIITIVNVNSQCSWTATDNNGDIQTLDLSCLQKEGALKTQDAEAHDYEFSVCANALSCKDDQVMVSQEGTGGAAGQCFIIGRFEASFQPTVTDELGGSWSFSYPNGDDDCSNTRTWNPVFKCDDAVEHQVGQVTESDSCIYDVVIYTRVCIYYIIHLYLYTYLYI